MIRLLSWNLNNFNRGRRAEKVRLLGELEWDIAMLQECDERTASLVADVSGVDDVVTALGACVPSSLEKNANGCALAVRRGAIRNARTWPSLAYDPEHRDQPFPERCLAADVTTQGSNLTAVSFHAPFVAGDGEEKAWRTARKESAYQHLIDGLSTIDGPVVVGMDANAWTDPVDLHPSDPTAEQPITNSFHLADPPHRLVDVYRVWLDAHRETQDQLRNHYPDGPLATTHNRGNNNYPTACRMDRIYASPVRSTAHIIHGYTEAITVGSDHAFVLAQIELS